MSEPVLSLSGITRSFQQGGQKLDVLRGIDLALNPGELVALVGHSGSGKSTMLQITGLLERPTAGSLKVDGVEAGRLGDGERTALRRDRIGFVYQYHHLMPEFSALENIAVPQMIAGVSRKAAEARGRALLAEVGLAGRADHRPAKLSGGEQQRVAICRALANKPKILLADEPTGNLDHATSDEVFALLTGLVRRTGLAALIATHNLELASRMDRTVTLIDGRLQ